MPAYVVDTDVVSEILLGDQELASGLRNLRSLGNRIYFSEATRGELHSWSQLSAENIAAADQLLCNAADAVIDVDRAVSTKAGELRRLSSQSVGQPCPTCGKVTGGKLKLPDALIAATAVTESATLITGNTRDYRALADQGVIAIMSSGEFLARFKP